MRLFLHPSSDWLSSNSCLQVRQAFDRRVGVNDPEWIALPGQMVFYALQNQGTAVTGCAGPDFLGRHPQGAFNAFIKLSAFLQVTQFSTKRHSNISHVL